MVVAALATAAAGNARADDGPDPEQGLPLIQTFAPAQFDSPATPVGSQVFDIDRAPDGALLLSNNEGLLRLDGGGWRTWNPIRGAVLATAARADGRVFIGGVDDLGYFDRFAGEFVSLRSWSKQIGQPFGEFWTVLADQRWAWFVDRERAYRWDGQQLQLMYTASGETRQGALLDGSAVILDPGIGLVALGQDAPRTIAGSALVAGAANCVLGKAIGAVATLCRDGVLRLWSLQGQSLELPLRADVAAQLAAARPSTLSALSGGGYAVATRQGGLFLLDRNGALQGRLSKANGFDDARIFSALDNATDGIWLGRDYGLAMVEWPGQVSRFDTDSGLPRIPLGVGRLDGRLYFVSSAGVFRLAVGDSGFAHAEPFALIGSGLFEVAQSPDALLVTSSDGLYALDAKGAQRLDARLSYTVAYVDGAPAHLVIGVEHGAWIMERTGQGWRDLGQLPGIHSEIRRIVAEDRSTVWLASRSSRELFRVSWPTLAGPSWTAAAARVEDFSAAPGVSPGPVTPLAFPDGPRFASAAGVFRFDARQTRFVADDALNALLPQANGELRATLILDADRLIVVQHDRYRVLQRTASGWSEHTSPLARIPRGAWPRSLYCDPDGTLWVTTSDAVYRHRPSTQSALPDLPPPRVALEGGTPVTTTALGEGSPLQLGVAPQSLLVRFSSAVYVGADRAQFRSRLLPLETDWGAWSPRALRELGFVPGGDFVLQVQTRDIFERDSPISSVAFHLDRPWYQRPWAIVLYVLGLASLVGLIVRWRDRQLRARAQALEAQVRERTKALEIASVTDQLTGLHNRRYFDIATRELFAQGSLTLVVLIDLDHFKRINDSCGHFVGDQVLMAVAGRLMAAAPRDAVLFRWGGEEFLLLAPLLDPAADATDCVRRILQRVGDTPIAATGAAPLDVTCSIGWEITRHGDSASIREALRLADENLYAAKNGGRDRALGPRGAICTRG